MKKKKNGYKVIAQSAEIQTDESLERFNGYEETVFDLPKPESPEKQAKKKNNKNAARIVICCVAAVVFLGSAGILMGRAIEKIKADKEQNRLNSLIVSGEEPESVDPIEYNKEQLALLKAEHPELNNIDFPDNFNYKYALLYAENTDFAGYLNLPGTNIDTAVVRGADGYYLNHDFNKNETRYGAIYMNPLNSISELDRNTVIYGHNMKDGSRFAALLKYKSLETYKEVPVIEFNTAFESHKWKVYGAFILNGSSDGDNGYLFNVLFTNVNDKCFTEFITEVDKRKLYNTGVDILPEDKILTLITCTYEFTDARLVVVARMVRENESETVDTSLATYKSTGIKYPQAYYDARKMNNPYKDDVKWIAYG